MIEAMEKRERIQRGARRRGGSNRHRQQVFWKCLAGGHVGCSGAVQRRGAQRHSPCPKQAGAMWTLLLASHPSSGWCLPRRAPGQYTVLKGASSSIDDPADGAAAKAWCDPTWAWATTR